MLEIPEHVRLNGPWSISKAQMAEKCSQQFDFRHHQKLKEISVYQASRVGTAVHRALELALQNAALKQAFSIAADEGELTENERVELYTFWDSVARYIKFIAELKRKVGCRDELFERRWGVRVDGSKCGFFDKDVFFRGVVDHGILTNANDLIIFDHKSGKEKELSYYDPQFRGYGLMAVAQIPNLRGVQTAIHFVVPGTERWNKPTASKTIREGLTPKRDGDKVVWEHTEDPYLDWLIKFLTKSCIKLLGPPAVITNKREKWKCDWCGFRTVCKGPFAAEAGRAESEGNN